MIDLPEICSVQELARACKVLSVRDIKEDCKAERITHHRRKSKIFIYREDAIEYLESLKCPRKTRDISSNGGEKGMSGRLSGSKGAGGEGIQRARTIANRLKNISKDSGKSKNVVQFHG